MADNTRKYGFRWVKSITGDSDCPPLVKVPLASGYAPTVGGTGVNLNPGDPIQIASTGYGTICVGSEGTQSVIYGIIAGFSPEYDGSVMQPRDKHISGSGAYGTNYERQNFMWVIPAMGQIFECDTDEVSAAYDTYAEMLAFIGENVDMILTADTTTSRATPQLDISSHAVTSTLQWRIEGISDSQQNTDFSGAYVKLLVSVNKGQQTPYNTTGV